MNPKKPRKPRNLIFVWVDVNNNKINQICFHQLLQNCNIKEAKKIRDWLTKAIDYLEAKEK